LGAHTSLRATFSITDTLTITSMLPGVIAIIDEAPMAIVRLGHEYSCNMS
jgi:hypothetical protein